MRERAIATVKLFTPRELGLLRDDHALDFLVADAQGVNQILVENLHATARDRTHRELLVEWDAELSDKEYFEWGVKCFCDLESHWDSAAGEREHNDVRAIRVSREIGGELSACLLTITEQAHVAKFQRDFAAMIAPALPLLGLSGA